MLVTTGLPREVSGKQLPTTQGQPDISPPGLTTSCSSPLVQDNGMNIELLRQMIERMEHGNIRIRKLNDFRRQRRINTGGLGDVSDSLDKEQIPNLATFMAQINNHMYMSAPLYIVTGSNAIEAQSCKVINPQLEIEEVENLQLGNTEWQDIINAKTQPIEPKPMKSNYVDYPVFGPAFKLDKSLKEFA